MKSPLSPAERTAHTLRVQTLFVQHQFQIRSFVHSLVPDFATADDVLQECFLTVSEKALEFELESNFQAWVRTVARYKVLALHRDRARVPGLLSEDVLEALIVSAPEADSEAPQAGQQSLEILSACLEKLAPAAREIVSLRYFSQHGPAEISRIRNSSVNAVNVTLARARETLRRCVEHSIQSAAS
jgi:RNA polymerase sigma-70 factor (ECF subfamily)